MALSIGTKVENEGTTSSGRLTADEFNELVEFVNATDETANTNATNIATNAEDIDALEETTDSHSKSIAVLEANGVMPFDGFVEGVSYNESAIGSSQPESIWYDTENRLFVALSGSKYYSLWVYDTEHPDCTSSYEMYNDDDGVLRKDKVYLYNKQLYIWDEDEANLVVAKPEVINNLRSEDTDIALSAYQGMLLNNDIEDLEELTETHTSEIEELQESASTNKSGVNSVTGDVAMLKQQGVAPFDGFVSGVSYSTSAVGSSVNSIWFDTTNKLFVALYSSKYYSTWDVDSSCQDLYQDDDGNIYTDKVYLYDHQLYVWSDDDETLVIVPPETATDDEIETLFE